MDNTSKTNDLRFRPDGTFTIVQFTDLHFGRRAESDVQSCRLMMSLLSAEQPDLVVFTGDVIDGRKCIDAARAWRQAMEPTEQYGARWAAVLGNHDDESNLTRQELISVQQQSAYCLTQAGPADLSGAGNFALNVLESHSNVPGAVLYFLDSGGLSPTGDGQYAWIMPDQIGWYREHARCVKSVCAGRPPRLALNESEGHFPHPAGLMFFHIPVPEYEDLSRVHGWRGNKLEPVCSPRVNSGLFTALKEERLVRGVFVGHDHLNDFEVEAGPLRLCYGRATGYGGYGRGDFPRGARVIRLSQHEPSFKTWIRTDERT